MCMIIQWAGLENNLFGGNPFAAKIKQKGKTASD